MNRKIKAAASLSMLGVLLGCAPFAPPVTPGAGAAPAPGRTQAGRVPVRVAPAEPVSPAMPAPEAWYASGRAAHGAGQLALAARHYEQALALAPGHVGALNGLAVVEAQQGRSDQAIALFARARQLAPGAAHIHNNAGYALMRAGRLDEAGPALRRALELDPGSAATRQNLEMLARAQAERGPVAAPQSAPLDASLPAAARLVQLGPQVYSLELPPAGAAAALNPAPAFANATHPGPAARPDTAGNAPAQSAVAMPGPGLKSIRLEVANGAGIARLARRTADRLALAGMATARLTNARPYVQATTEIQFVPGQEAAAQALQSRLPLAARAVASSPLPAGMQLRLVLGHDAAGQAIAAWLDAVPAQQASAAGAGESGWRWS